MERRVERIVEVVTPTSDGGTTRRRYAVLDDGERVADPGFRGGSISVSFGGPPPDVLRAEDEYRRRAARQPSPRSFLALAHALAEAGVAATPDELAELPLGFEHSDRVAAPDPALAARRAELERRARKWRPVVVALGSIVLPALFPRLNRYRTVRRETWRRQFRRGLIGWAFANLVRELLRPRRPL